MKTVLQPPPQPVATAEQQLALAELRLDHPGWCVSLTPGRTVAWFAKRRRDAAWRGGVLAVEATTPEGLRELLDAQHVGGRP